MNRIVLFKTDQLLHKLNTLLLSREGFIFMIATSGENILRMLKDDIPDLVILDLDLPDMSGAECCHAIKSDPRLRHVPVVMLAPSGRDAAVNLEQKLGSKLNISQTLFLSIVEL